MDPAPRIIAQKEDHPMSWPADQFAKIYRPSSGVPAGFGPQAVPTRERDCLRPLRTLSMLLAACVLAGWMTVLFRGRLPGVTGLYPLAGVAFVGMWCCAQISWPVVLLAQLVTAVGLETPTYALPTVVLSDFGSIALSVWWLRRIVSNRHPIAHMRDTAWWLIICALVTPLLGSFSGALSLWLTQPSLSGLLPELILVRWLATALGVLLIVPVSFAWWPWRRLLRNRKRAVEAAALAAAALAVGAWVARDSSHGSLPIPDVACWVPLFAWCASRFGRRGITLLISTVGLWSLFAAIWLRGASHRDDGNLIPPAMLLALSNNVVVDATLLMISVWLKERRQASLSLSTTEVRYRILFENSPDAVFVVAGGEESLREFNDRLPELLGYSRQQLTQMHRCDFELGIPMLSMRSSVASVYSPKTSEFDAKYRRADGTIIDVSVTYSVIDFFGDAAYLMIARDVTVRRQAEQQIRESEAKFRTLAETIPALVAIQRDGKALYVNPALVTLSGYQATDLLRSDLIGLIRTEFQAEARHQVERCLRGERPAWRREVSLRTKSGEERWIDLAVAPIKLEGQAAWLATAVDTTERRRTEVELRQLNAQLFHAGRLRMLGELAAGIAHRVKHPIGNVGNFTKALVNDLDRGQATSGAKLRETLVMILEAADQANHTISEMLDFARRHEMDRTKIDLAPLVTDAARIARFDRRWADVAIQIHTDSERPKAFADRAEITQVLIDLFRNGLEAMETTPTDERRLSVEVRSEGAGWLRVSITDCGCGVTPEQQSKLFRPFETTKDEGLGLGLSLCKTIVECHGGRLWYQPASPRGSTFHFLLPSEVRLIETPAPATICLEA